MNSPVSNNKPVSPIQGRHSNGSKPVGRPVRNEEDLKLDLTLRPDNFDEFVGQDKIVHNLNIYISAARKRQEPLDHLLFSGLPGLGKTTLAYLVAKECQSSLKTTSGPVLEKPADLAGILSNLKKGDVLFIDEIHRIPTVVEEYLYSAMEDFTINIMIDQGPHARSITLNIPHFTLVGATTREGLLTDALRSRFGIWEKLNLYHRDDLIKIIKRSAQILGVQIAQPAAELLASCGRGTPRVVNRMLKRIRDLAQIKSNNVIDEKIAHEGLQMLGIDEAGLDETDRKILQTLINHDGGPMGLKTIAVSVGEEEDTIEEVYEPYLIQCCFLEKTPRGRKATRAAYEHLNSKLPAESNQKNIFK